MKNNYNFACPAPQPNWIIREDLLANIRRAVIKKSHYFLSAPGGYGKTVGAAQSMNNVGGCTAWLKIEEDDSNIIYFYHRLLHAIGVIVPRKEYRTALKNYIGDYSLSAALELLSLLPRTGKRCYLVIDDLHLASEEIKLALPMVTSRLSPEYITIGFLSREGILKNLENTVVFGREALAFSDQEVAQFFVQQEKLKIRHTPEEIRSATDGWILGIQTLIMGGMLPLELESGSTIMLENYIKEHIWNLWNSETKDFLLRSSFIPQLTEEACQFLTGDPNAKETLEHICENIAFLTKVSENTYRFHDLFGDFLRHYAEQNLLLEELCSIRDASAEWLFNDGHFLAAAKLYIDNLDHVGVDKCITQTSKQQNNISIDSFISFSREIILPLPKEMLTENYNLLIERAWYAFLTGDSETFTGDMGALFENQEEIAQIAPEIMERFIFLGSLFYELPLRAYAQGAVEQLQDVPQEALFVEHEVSSSAITHNSPYFHRSMRDFSEYHQLLEEDLDTLRKSFGKMIGRDYLAMELCLQAGILYEQNQLYKALELALKAYDSLSERSSYEAVFCTTILLASLFDSLKAEEQVVRLYREIAEYVKTPPANTLLSNYKAMVIMRNLAKGNKGVGESWLESHPIETTTYLSFYRLGWHYASLRSHIAVEDYAEAAHFGQRLQRLGREYQRPLDVIESSILLAIAYYRSGKENNAEEAIKTALKTAIPYGYIRLFLNNGPDIFDVLANLIQKDNLPKGQAVFLKRIVDELGRESGVAATAAKQKLPPPKRRKILAFISEGLSYHEIAEKTGLTHGTVKTIFASSIGT